MKKPAASIIMSVFNGESYLKEAIESILDQTFRNFEFIIVNDFSSDNSLAIIDKYDDPRIILLNNKKNLGLAASLNKALKISKGEFILRMDDDDISFPNRIEKQIEFMNNNNSCGISGTYAEIFGESEGIRKHSTETNELKIRSLFSCQFCHPTIIIRKNILDKYKLYYDEKFSTAQDYELWSRMIDKTEFRTLPKVLLKYRTHNKQISVKNNTNQKNNTNKIHINILKKIGLKATEESLKTHTFISKFPHRMCLKKIKLIEIYLVGILNANKQSNLVNQDSLFNFFSEYFYNVCKKSKANPFVKSYIFNKSILSENQKIKHKTIKILTAFLLN